MKYQSNAQWPKGQYPFGNDVSTDQHRNKESAEAVCNGLANDGWGGERKIFPVKVWVNPVENCQTGRADICLAGSKDGICCAEHECDIDLGVRA